VTSEARARCHSKINVRVRLWESRSTPTLGGVKFRLWKDHLKNDLRSDQDHRQKIDLRSRSRSRSSF
jgi:hypothetical protein